MSKPYTPELVALEIKKACDIFKMYPNGTPKGYRSSLDPLLPQSASHPRPFFPTPQEIDMADTVHFNWMPLLLPQERRLLWHRFSGKRWKVLAYEEGLTIRQARYKIKQTLLKLTHLLNKK